MNMNNVATCAVAVLLLSYFSLLFPYFFCIFIPTFSQGCAGQPVNVSCVSRLQLLQCGVIIFSLNYSILNYSILNDSIIKLYRPIYRPLV